MRKYVIYTALLGDYDQINQPAVVDERFDYILFTDRKIGGSCGVWKVRWVDKVSDDLTKCARWVKTHPELLLKDYDCSLWIDASIQIMDAYIYDKIIDLHNKSAKISSVIHPERDCVYDEICTVIEFGVESERKALRWGHFLRREGFERNYGLHETGLLFRMHSDGGVKLFDSLWWECIDSNSSRDQLSFDYCLWKCNIICENIMPRGCSVRNTEHFSLKRHKNEMAKHNRLGRDEGWLAQEVYRSPNTILVIHNLYYKIMGFRRPFVWAYVIGQLYRLRNAYFKCRKKLLTLRNKV